MIEEVNLEPGEDIPGEHQRSRVRKLIDSPFLLLIISLLIVFSSYTIWGTIELFRTPPGVLP